MKKILTTLTVIAATLISSACWFTESNFNATYIASVNGSAVHYSPVESINQATYTNGQTVDLPLTVQVKVSDRFGDQEGESGTRPIVKAILQYKISSFPVFLNCSRESREVPEFIVPTLIEKNTNFFG